MHSLSEPFTVSASHELRPIDFVSRTVALLGRDLDQLLTHDLYAHQGPRRKVQGWQLIAGLAGALPAVYRSLFPMQEPNFRHVAFRFRLGPTPKKARAICSHQWDVETGEMSASLFKDAGTFVSRLAITPLEGI